jgi:HEAT repeat protein
MMRKFLYILFLLLIIFIFSVAAQEPVKSITDDWRETLKYGIDSEVIEVIKKIQSEKRKGFEELLSEVLNRTINTEIMERIFSLFEETGAEAGVERADEILNNYRDWKESLVAGAMSYRASLEEHETAAFRDTLYLIAREGNDRLAARAVKSIGALTQQEDETAQADFLMELYDDSRTPAQVKEQILLALGEIKAAEAAEMLADIVRDEYEDLIFRQYAVHSLGKLGDKEYLPVITEALASDQALLRAYGAAALENIEGEEATKLLMEALRDSFWRTRKSALETLGKRKAEAAVPIITYKARKDPEKVIRMEALKALGNIGSPDAMEFLKETFINPKIPADLRLEAFRYLITTNFSQYAEDISKIIAEEWEKEKPALLNGIGRILSTVPVEENDQGLLEIFQRFLTHHNIVVQIYGIRGISINGYTQALDRIRNLTDEKTPSAVRRQALSAFEELGGNPAALTESDTESDTESAE